MKIKKNSTILQDFDSKIDSEIIISEDVEVNLIQIVNNEKINSQINITLERGAKLNIVQFIFNCENFDNCVYLKDSSKYNLKSAFYINNANLKIVNSSIHVEKNSHSNMNIKGAVINGSRVICDGIVRIEKNAKKSQGYQNINGLILDDNSIISSEPILEINNNDVKCSHGCSISQIKEEILFYMENRGISKKDAINLVLEGMFLELFTYILDKEIKKRIETLIYYNLYEK